MSQKRDVRTYERTYRRKAGRTSPKQYALPTPNLFELGGIFTGDILLSLVLVKSVVESFRKRYGVFPLQILHHLWVSYMEPLYL